MYIAILIFLIILFIQFAIGAYAWSLRKSLPKKYSHPISAQIESSQLVEMYYNDERYKFNFEAVDLDDEPAFAESRLLLVNKKQLYKKDLFTNFYIIFQAELTKDNYWWIRKFNSFQSFIFFTEIFVFVLSLAFFNEFFGIYLLYFAIFLQLESFVAAFFGIINIGYILEDSVGIALPTLELDNVEEARVNALKSDLKYIMMEYPWEILWRFTQFFS